ncbi:MAG: YtxH domain-containing protein [Chloroflexi bacterium]|nr:YtxH domain-containing protein [Chloroflexota bacterium]
MASEERGPGFGIGLILGGVIGALAGLILAPGPGEETRTQFMGRTAGLRQKAEELRAAARERVREVIEEGKVVASRMRGEREVTSPEEPSSDNLEEPSI